MKFLKIFHLPTDPMPKEKPDPLANNWKIFRHPVERNMRKSEKMYRNPHKGKGYSLIPQQKKS